MPPIFCDVITIADGFLLLYTSTRMATTTCAATPTPTPIPVVMPADKSLELVGGTAGLAGFDELNVDVFAVI